MQYHLLDVVRLSGNMTGHGFSTGCVGAVIEIYDENFYEMEFVDIDGTTRAVVVLNAATDFQPARCG